MIDVIGEKAFIPIRHSFLCPVYDSQMIFLFSVVFSFMTEVDNKIGHSSRSSSMQRRKQLRRCLVMLNNFEKFSFPSIEKRWSKDKETDRQKEKRQEKTKKKKRKREKKEKKRKRKKKEKGKKRRKKKKKEKKEKKRKRKKEKKRKKKKEKTKHDYTYLMSRLENISFHILNTLLFSTKGQLTTDQEVVIIEPLVNFHTFLIFFSWIALCQLNTVLLLQFKITALIFLF